MAYICLSNAYLDVSLEYLNKPLSNIPESPIPKKRLHSPDYCKKRNWKVTKKLTNEVVRDTSFFENKEQVNPDS